jgi:hypothetical protein
MVQEPVEIRVWLDALKSGDGEALAKMVNYYPMFSVMIRKSLAGKGRILD